MLSVYARRYVNPPDNAYVKVELFKQSVKPGEVGSTDRGYRRHKIFPERRLHRKLVRSAEPDREHRRSFDGRQ